MAKETVTASWSPAHLNFSYNFRRFVPVSYLVMDFLSYLIVLFRHGSEHDAA